MPSPGPTKLLQAIQTTWRKQRLAQGLPEELEAHREHLAELSVRDLHLAEAVTAFWLHVAAETILKPDAVVTAWAGFVQDDTVDIRPAYQSKPLARHDEGTSWLEYQPSGFLEGERIGWLIQQRNIGLVGVPFEMEKGVVLFFANAFVLPVGTGYDLTAPGLANRTETFALDSSGWLGSRTSFLYLEFRFLEMLAILARQPWRN